MLFVCYLVGLIIASIGLIVCMATHDHFPRKKGIVLVVCWPFVFLLIFLDT
jgi:hypothetical protein